MGEIRNAQNNLVGKHEGKSHSENLGVDENILKCILGKQCGKV
jgi:hypothetical protein